jgi:hypothetical protein
LPPSHLLIELNLVAVLIEVFVQEDPLVCIDPVGGPRGGWMGGGSWGSPMWSRMWWMGAVSVMNAMIRIVAPQAGQASGKVS